MANYSKQGGFGGGRPSFGGKPRFGGKPSFGGKKPWGDKREGGPVTMHKATCAKCSKECEVPFRPMQGKPVYCKDCFDRTGGNPKGDRFEKRDFKKPFDSRGPRPSFDAPRMQGDDGIKKQLEQVNVKLDRLISAIEGMTRKVELADAVATVTKKAPAKTKKKPSKK